MKIKFIPAKPNEIQVDIDRPAAPLHPDVFERLGSLVGIRGAVMSPSRSGNTHWTVTLAKRLPLMERIAWALALGDDPVRGMLNIQRARGKKPRPMIFFERRKNAKTKTCI